MSENTPFHNFNITHGTRNNYQVTLTFMENEANPLNYNEKNEIWLTYIGAHQKQITPIKCENTPLQHSNVTHCTKNNYQVITLTFIGN